MANSLFSLSAECNELYYALIDTADKETGEVDVDIAAALEKVQGDFEEKAVATAQVARKLGFTLDEIKAEIDRLTALKKHVERQEARVKKYLADNMLATGIVKIESIYANISFRKSEQTIIDDEKLLPAEYFTEKITYTPNKTAIKAALKDGKEVQGAHIEVVNNIQIK